MKATLITLGILLPFLLIGLYVGRDDKDAAKTLLGMMVLGTAIWAAFDASGLERPADDITARSIHPVRTFFGILLLWIFYFPSYSGQPEQDRAKLLERKCQDTLPPAPPTSLASAPQPSESSSLGPSGSSVQGSSKPLQEDTYSRLEKLADLKTKGVLTEAEFQAEKAKLLSGSGSSTSASSMPCPTEEQLAARAPVAGPSPIATAPTHSVSEKKPISITRAVLITLAIILIFCGFVYVIIGYNIREILE